MSGEVLITDNEWRCTRCGPVWHITWWNSVREVTMRQGPPISHADAVKLLNQDRAVTHALSHDPPLRVVPLKASPLFLDVQ